ncbi:ribonuclease HII [Sporosarcina sp. USHLN248]|uniref:ribonuclease HII n=1 Tax=Sporosarcina sp. USHLN248 TaxID=3081300 RepID=UPI0038B53ACC
MAVKTVKEISNALKKTLEMTPWIEELAADERAGVQTALKRWHRENEKRKRKLIAYEEKKSFDKQFKRFAGDLVAGIDEAGRGPLAGPVVCAAVILPEDAQELIGLDDSKKISKSERERYAAIIRDIAVSYAVHIQSARRIDELNIYAATRESMERTVEQLPIKPDIVIADAMQLTVSCPSEAIIKGDAQSLAIAAASILAKTTRDHLMDELDNEYPMYKFKNNAGYGTADHLEALYMHGPCEHHRKTFEPIKSMLKRREADEPSFNSEFDNYPINK